MKKRHIFPKRLVSLLLALLLCVGTAAIGVTSVAAAEIASGDHVKYNNLYPNTVVNAGAVLELRQGSGDQIYIDDELVPDVKNQYVFEQRLIYKGNTRLNGQWPIVLRYDFATLERASKAETEEELKTAIATGETVTLMSDIEMRDAIEIRDGKTHTFNTNGYSLTIANQSRSTFVISGGSTVIFNGSGKAYDSKLSNGKAHSGGLIWVTGDAKVILQGMNVSNSAVETTGGAIYAENGTVELENCTVRENSAKGDGGVIYAMDSKLIVKSTTFSQNHAVNGGAVYLMNSTAELNNCSFEGNTASQNGGGFYINESSAATLTNCTFDANSAGDGGGVCNKGTVTINSSKLHNNTVRGGGGGIWSTGNATLTGTEVSGNLNAVNGGGVTNHNNMTLTNCTISDNNVSSAGGGLYIDTNGKTEIADCSITGNTAKDGGGMFVHKGSVNVSNSVMDNNNAKTAGGAMWANSGTTVAYTQVSMKGNSCGTNGGSLNSHGNLSLNNCKIEICTAGNSGGGIYMDTNGALTLHTSQVIGCTAATGGGGINFYAGKLVLAGGKTVINGSSVNDNAANIYFRQFNPIQVTGTFTEDSAIGFVPPDNAQNYNATTGFKQYNKADPYRIFHSDTLSFKVKRNSNLNEAQLERFVDKTYSGYNIRVHVRCTNDVNYWDWAYLYIYGRDGRGSGGERHLATSHDFHESIDGEGKEFDYEFNCGESFPTRVDFTTKFGLAATWRGFDAEVTVYINGVNSGNRVCVHDVYGVETLTSSINIGGDKYPVLEYFDVDSPNTIEGTGVITIASIDQYGVVWKAGSDNVSMENISFPGEDTFEQADNTGLKWKVSSTHTSNHTSIYEISFKSASNVYPTITKSFTVNFAFPLTVSVVVKEKVVFETTGVRGDKVVIKDVRLPVGYTLNKYERSGPGILNKIDHNNYEFTFVNESIRLTAVLKPIVYTIAFFPNAEVDRGTMSSKSPEYDKKFPLPKNNFKRKGYTFVGWNTQPDGMGTMYKNKAEVLNLTSDPNEIVNLYAIWKPDQATTGSIFSDGTALIFVGAGLLIAAVIGAVIFSAYKKKRKLTEKTE